MVENILLVGAVDAALARGAGLRGLTLVDRWHASCRVALIAVRGGEAKGLPHLALVQGDAALIAALDGGAADAVDSAAAVPVIVARLAALVRRTADATQLRCGDLVVDQVARRVTRAGVPIALLPREYMLLLFLIRHADTVVPRAVLREVVWGLEFDPGTNVIEVHMSRLRAKIDRGFATPMLHTARGVGYCLVSQPARQSPIAAVALAG